MPLKIPQSGLVAHYPLNEAGGLIAMPRVGITRGAISTCTWVQSPLGKTLNWAGPTTNNVPIGKLSYLNLQNQLTVSAWVRITDVSGAVNSGYRYLVSDYNSGGNQAQFALLMTNGVRFCFFWVLSGTQSPSPASAQGATTVVANTIYHVVGVRSGSSGSWRSDIYVNGRVDGGATTATNPATQANAGTPTIGRPGDYTAAALGMVGQIADVRIYNRALSATEIRQLYTNGINK